MLSSITRFLRDEEGATAIEYGIIAGLMAIVLAGIFSEGKGIAKALDDVFKTIADTLSGTAAGGGTT